MKPLTHGLPIALLVLATPAWTQTVCRAEIKPAVQIAEGSFSLADLLSPDSCPQVRDAAAHLRLGVAPLPGSERVFSGDQLRALLGDLESTWPAMVEIPGRVRVRRAGTRASCSEIAARVFPRSSPSESGSNRRNIAESLSFDGSDCGSSERIPSQSVIHFSSKVWDPALQSWELRAHCANPQDCVPFLVRVPAPREAAAFPASGPVSSPAPTSLAETIPPASAAKFIVHPGDRATLFWDQSGIRLVVSTVCLDRGGEGETVRARVLSTGKVVLAVVISAGVLRSAS